MKKAFLFILGIAAAILPFYFAVYKPIVWFFSFGRFWGILLTFVGIGILLQLWNLCLEIISPVLDYLEKELDEFECRRQERCRREEECRQRQELEQRRRNAERKRQKLEEERMLKKQKEDQKRREDEIKYQEELKLKKAMQLENLRKNLLPLKEMDIVLVDTCCLMREGENINLFFENLASIGVKLTVIEDVYGELNRHKADETNTSRQYGARLALKRIEDMQDNGCCTINPFLSNKTFYADDKFIEMTTTLCKEGKKIITITDDRDLRIKIKSRLESFYSPEQVRKTVVKIDDFFN